MFSPSTSQNPPQLTLRYPAGETTEGANPRSLSVKALRQAGHKPMPLLRVIRQKCLDCSCNQPGEIRKCTATGCALWPFRMGTNPFRAKARANRGSFGNHGNLPGNSRANGRAVAEVST